MSKYDDNLRRFESERSTRLSRKKQEGALPSGALPGQAWGNTASKDSVDKAVNEKEREYSKGSQARSIQKKSGQEAHLIRIRDLTIHSLSTHLKQASLGFSLKIVPFPGPSILLIQCHCYPLQKIYIHSLVRGQRAAVKGAQQRCAVVPHESNSPRERSSRAQHAWSPSLKTISFWLFSCSYPRREWKCHQCMLAVGTVNRAQQTK